jgi:hypothetical protein
MQIEHGVSFYVGGQARLCTARVMPTEQHAAACAVAAAALTRQRPLAT